MSWQLFLAVLMFQFSKNWAPPVCTAVAEYCGITVSGIVKQGTVLADVTEDLRQDLLRESHLGDLLLLKKNY